MKQQPRLITTALILLTIAANSSAQEAGALQSGVVKSFNGYEGISEPFYFDIDIESDTAALVLGKLLGENIAISLAPGRTQAGIVESLEQTGVRDSKGLYRLRLVPEIAKLRYVESSRTFQELSITEIASEVFDGIGLEPTNAATGSYDPRAVSIQHRESDLNFVSRLLESAGLHYHFRQGGAALVLGDQNNVFPQLSDTFVYNPNTSKGVYLFSRGEKLQSTRIDTGDFNWQQPGNAPAGTDSSSKPFGELRAGVFPFGAKNNEQAQRQADILLDQENTQAERCYGASTYAQFSAGHRFNLSKHPRTDFNTSYLITAIKHVKDDAGYRNEFTCQPSSVTYRKRQTTPKPIMPGIVSAIVVGPSGETKHVDEFGRVKVRFPWRRAGTSAAVAGDAGWVRVLQIGAGQSANALWLPDVGDEVAVAFENGDPDRPVVLGSLFNAENPPPVTLPDDKDTSVFRFESASGVATQIEIHNRAGEEHIELSSGESMLVLDPKGIRTNKKIETP